MDVSAWVCTLNQVYHAKKVKIDRDRIINSKINPLIILRRDLERGVSPSDLEMTEEELLELYESIVNTKEQEADI